MFTYMEHVHHHMVLVTMFFSHLLNCLKVWTYFYIFLTPASSLAPFLTLGELVRFLFCSRVKATSLTLTPTMELLSWIHVLSCMNDFYTIG